MQLTVTNMGPKATIVSVVDGSNPGVQELAAGVSTVITGDCTVAIVGDKPDLQDQFSQAAAALRELLRKLRDRLARQGGAKEAADLQSLGVGNNGKLPVRAILGDGVTEETINPGVLMELECKGYVELRELGHVAGSDDPAQQQAGTIA